MTDLKTEFLGEGPVFNVDHMAGVYNESPYTIPGVSDGGAHTKFFTGGAWTTDFLAWMVRDEKKITLEEAHYRMSALAAHAAGFQRPWRAARGRAGRRHRLRHRRARRSIPRGSARPVYDLPGGEWRRVQRAHGYRHILVNGVETFTDGECTGATPGKLLRHGKG